jgi:dethiobiotin synthetase
VPPVFVTATGTGLGKTFLTCALVRRLRAAGRPVRAVKPVASGIDPDAPQGSDTALILEALSRPLTPEAMDAVSPWRFRAPLAPTMAARREGRRLDLDAVTAFCRAQAATGGGERLVIEGVGGVMAPVDDDHTVLDWMAALGPRVVLVAGGYVGTISHTLTALLALDSRHLDPFAVVVSESGTEDEPPLTETLEALARLAPGVPLVGLPRLDAGTAPAHPAIGRVLELSGAPPGR